MSNFAANKPTSPRVLLSEEEHIERLRKARPDWWQNFAATLALTIAMLCLVGGMWRIQSAVELSAQAHPSPVKFIGKWVPLKPLYHPGEDATFRFVREANFTGDQLFLENIFSFENNDTGASYTGGMSVRALSAKDRGQHVGYAVRTIPNEARPGKNYTFEGMIRSQTSYRTLPTGFVSEPFEVRSWLSEQERALYERSSKRDKLKAAGLDSEVAEVSK